MHVVLCKRLPEGKFWDRERICPLSDLKYVHSLLVMFGKVHVGHTVRYLDCLKRSKVTFLSVSNARQQVPVLLEISLLSHFEIKNIISTLIVGRSTLS